MRADRTDGQTFVEKVLLFPPDQEYIHIHVYTCLDYFSNFTPILTEVSIPFFHMELGMKTALDYLYPFFSFSVHNFCTRTDGRTDICRKSFIFSSWSRVYIHVNTYLDYFSNFTPYDILLTKVSIPFFHIWNRYENSNDKFTTSVGRLSCTS